MATVRTLIADALAELGVVGVGASVSADDEALALRKLNGILSAWSNSPLSVWEETEVSVPLDGSQTYTIGATGDVATTRPVEVRSAYCRSTGGIDHAVTVINRRQWESIGNKTLAGGPVSEVWYEATVPNGTLHVYPQAGATYTLKLSVLKPLTAFASVNTSVTMPDGYEEALTLALAEALAPSFRAELSPVTLKRFNGLKAAIRRVNASPLYLGEERGEEYEIERGY